jgi:hypothetical protein
VGQHIDKIQFLEEHSRQVLDEAKQRALKRQALKKVSD